MTLCRNFTHFSPPPPSQPTSINGYQWAFRVIDEFQGGVLSVKWISPSPPGGGGWVAAIPLAFSCS